MIEFLPQDEMSLEDWVICSFPGAFHPQALALCRAEGLGKEVQLPRNSWECLELHLRKQLGFLSLQGWILKEYSPDEHIRVAEFALEEKNLSLEEELSPQAWAELKDSYERITCR